MPKTRARVSILAVTLSLLVPATSRAEDPVRGEPIHLTKAAGPIELDGRLGDPGWQGATRIDTWYETNPADNTPAKVKNVGYLTYDDHYFYAGFEFEDPDPSSIRAPLGDRDNVPSYTDYGGIIIDCKNDRRTAILFLANARGIPYDAVTDDGNEDSSPDFYWDAATQITKTGWTLEMRIPFSTLRYPVGDPQTWVILLYRNWPRDRRTQMFSAKLPRGSSCFICHESELTGLSGLPTGGKLIAAPYVSARQMGEPEGELGSPLVNRPVKLDGGLDVKWTPTAGTAIDATFRPDFSQVESDVAQISANERFALFYPEKRPFFLEGIELFSTPIQAVYTRTITSPRWGARATGKLEGGSYTLLVADDRGGGSVILPGSLGSDLAEQDFSSIAVIGRARKDLGRSFVSFLASDREVRGGASNRVFGPDFQFRPDDRNTVTGQLLFSQSKTPERPDLAAEWNGQRLSSHAADVWWSRATPILDTFVEYKDIGDEFRADNGFVPQVGFREGYLEVGATNRPTGFFSRVRTFVMADYQAQRDGDTLSQYVSPGVGVDGPLNSFGRFRADFSRVRTDATTTISRSRVFYTVQLTPSKTFSRLSLDGSLGEEIDFANSRPGHGGRVTLDASIRPSIHLELMLSGERRWLDVKPEIGGPESRLFTASLLRAKATYSFTAKMFLRVIGQYVETTRDPSLYGFAVPKKAADFTASALFAYKINWQTVAFLGYDDSRVLSIDDRLEPAGRQLFLKISYAFQR